MTTDVKKVVNFGKRLNTSLYSPMDESQTVALHIRANNSEYEVNSDIPVITKAKQNKYAKQDTFKLI